MLSHIIEPEIRQLIEGKDFSTLKEVLAGLDVHDLAELAGALDGEGLGVVFRLLARRQAAEVFAALSLETQERLLEILSGEALTGILNQMPPDDRTELLEDLPEDVSRRLIETLDRRQRQVAIELLRYPEDSVGRLMTPEFVAVRADWTVRRILEHLRQVAPRKETLDVLYVVDAQGRLVDDLPLAEVVLADPETPAEALIDRQPVALDADEDREEAVELFKKYDAVALPVRDATGRLVGIVTIDDVMDVQEAETTEDFHKMAAVAALEEPYFATTYAEMLRKRLPWLALLFAAELIVVAALANFQSSLETTLFALTVIFMPLINATAGNAGSQMAGLVIRGLAVHEISPAHWWRVLGRELALGATLGATLGMLGVAAAMLVFRLGGAAGAGTPANAVGVGVSIAVAVTLANLAGAMIPLAFKRIGLDPAVTSGPFLASVMDVGGVLIYFTTAATVLALWRS